MKTYFNNFNSRDDGTPLITDNKIQFKSLMHVTKAATRFQLDEPDFKVAIDDLAFKKIKKMCASKLKEDGDNWKGYKFDLKMALLIDIGVIEENTLASKGYTNCLGLSVLHAIILLNDKNLLTEALKKEPQIDSWLEGVIIPSKLDAKEKQSLVENEWIQFANCFHLAARFNPIGLHQMLLQFNNDKTDNFSLKEEGTISPIHVAAMNSKSLSLE